MKFPPLLASAWASGYASGWWLAEWLWVPGNERTGAIVFEAFAANLVVLVGMTAWAFWGQARKAVGG